MQSNVRLLVWLNWPTLQTSSYSLCWNTSPHGITSVRGNYQSLSHNFDLDNFMKNAKSKYTHYVKDNMWTKSKIIKDIKKDLEIVALNSKIHCLEVLLVKTTGGNLTLKNILISITRIQYAQVGK